MNEVEQFLVSVFKKDKYERDLHGVGVIVGMVVKQYINDETEGYSRSDFLKGINEGLSKDPEKIETA
jgi:hypothetical protein